MYLHLPVPMYLLRQSLCRAMQKALIRQRARKHAQRQAQVLLLKKQQQTAKTTAAIAKRLGEAAGADRQSNGQRSCRTVWRWRAVDVGLCGHAGGSRCRIAVRYPVYD